MPYDFETLIDRRGTGSMKGRIMEQLGLSEDVLPLQGAEFDFPTCPHVARAMEKRGASGAYCFAGSDAPEYLAAVRNWMDRVRGWEIETEWIVPAPGVIRSLCTSIRAFAREGEGVVIQPPVFGVYRDRIAALGREVVENRLVYDRGRYRIDFADLEEKLSRENVKLMILCNPINPMGTVIAPDDLHRILELTQKYGVVVHSDEIFGDYIRGEHRAVPAAAGIGAKNALVSCSLGKSFSFAGALHGNVFIPDPELRRRYLAQQDLDYYDGMDPFLYTAVMAAYTPEGEDWLWAMQDYVEQTTDYVKDFFARHFPEILVCEHQVGFLLWIDWSAWGMEEEQLHQYLARAGLYVDKGSKYDPACGAFTRMVVACPRRYVEKALERLLALRRQGD